MIFSDLHQDVGDGDRDAVKAQAEVHGDDQQLDHYDVTAAALSDVTNCFHSRLRNQVTYRHESSIPRKMKNSASLKFHLEIIDELGTFPGQMLHDPRDQGHLPLAALRLHQGVQHLDGADALHRVRPRGQHGQDRGAQLP